MSEVESSKYSNVPLSRRGFVSATWNIVSNSSRVSILLFRSILLARLLPVDAFGVYALASSIIGLSLALPSFGMGGAFLHRTKETINEEKTAAAHFTIEAILSGTWALLLMTGAYLFTAGNLRVALFFLTAVSFGMQLAQTPRLILMRRVMHQRLALLQIINAVFATLVPLALAFRGVELWALLSINLIELLLTVFTLYLYHPVWKPRFGWSPEIVRYFLRFGSRNVWSKVLVKALDRVDDLWTGCFLGNTALGLYSRAYTFATYPRQTLAVPINSVAGGIYSELHGDRLALSQAFFRINAVLIRTGFFFAGLLMLVGPEFIGIVLGSKWLPMLSTFRLMLIFTLFDPIRATIDRIFIAVGKPQILVKVKLIQLALLVAGLFVLGTYFHIAGIAVAVNLMLMAGIVILLWKAKAHVDYSAIKLLLFPGVAFVAAAGATYVVLHFVNVSNIWYVAATKISIFLGGYFGILLSLEYPQVKNMMILLRGIFRTEHEEKIEGMSKVV